MEGAEFFGEEHRSRLIDCNRAPLPGRSDGECRNLAYEMAQKEWFLDFRAGTAGASGVPRALGE
jgi:hypothetical protein